MAFIKSMVLTILVHIVANVGAHKTTKAQYQQLIYQSMKSIVSLDELVTTLSVQVARLTTSLSELKDDVKKMGEQNVELSTSLTNVNERVTKEGAEVTNALMKVNKRITEESERVTKEGAEVTNALMKLNNRITEESAVAASATNSTQSELDRTNTGIITMQSSLTETVKNVGKISTDIAVTMKGVGNIQTEINKLKTSNVEISQKVDKLNKQVSVVSVEETGGNGNCLRVCAGTTGRNKSNWQNHSTWGVKMHVSIGYCGFVRTPTITTTIEGTSDHWGLKGTSSIYNATPKGFTIYLYMSKLRVKQAFDNKWNVEWIAVGHTC